MIFISQFSYVFHVFQTSYLTVGIGIFIGNQCCFGLMDVVRVFADIFFDDIQRHFPTHILYSTQLCTCNDGSRTCFVGYDMAVIRQNHFFPTVHMGKECQLIAHHAAGYKQTSFLAHDFRCQRFQFVYGLVIAINVVAHNSFIHGFTHFLGGHRYGVASQIDFSVNHSDYASPVIFSLIASISSLSMYSSKVICLSMIPPGRISMILFAMVCVNWWSWESNSSVPL